MMKTVSKTYGEEPFAVEMTMVFCGKDLSLTITGGTEPHIGASALAVYEPERDSATVSCFTLYGHRDNLPAEKFAKLAAVKFKCTAQVSAGIHVDHASPEDIEVINQNCQKCWESLLAANIISFEQ